jgi:hypothetical protein
MTLALYGYQTEHPAVRAASKQSLSIPMVAKSAARGADRRQ